MGVGSPAELPPELALPEIQGQKVYKDADGTVTDTGTLSPDNINLIVRLIVFM